MSVYLHSKYTSAHTQHVSDCIVYKCQQLKNYKQK